jgi:DNA repair protein RadC
MSDPTYPPLRVKDLAVADRPQERLEQLGAGALSDTELLAMLLRSGSRGHNVIAVAQHLIAEAGSLAGLTRWRDADFRRLKGIGRVKALQLVTVMEIARRVLASEAGAEPLLNRPESVYAYFRPLVTGLTVEKFWVLCLNRKNRLQKLVEVSSGTATHALAHPREVFREAIRHSATAVICVHNHPSGDPTPSRADIEMTQEVRDAARVLGVVLHDHVIVGNGTWLSFRREGLLA